MSDPRLEDAEFRALMDHAMKADWPEDVDRATIRSLLSGEAAARGYDSWHVAYSEFGKVFACGHKYRLRGMSDDLPNAREAIAGHDVPEEDVGEFLKRWVNEDDGEWVERDGERWYPEEERPDRARPADPETGEPLDHYEWNGRWWCENENAGFAWETGEVECPHCGGVFYAHPPLDEIVTDPCSCGPKEACSECPEWKRRLEVVEQRASNVIGILEEMGRDHETSDGRPPASPPERLDEIEEAARKARADTKDETTARTVTARLRALEQAVDGVEPPGSGEKASDGPVTALRPSDLSDETKKGLVAAVGKAAQRAMNHNADAGETVVSMDAHIAAPEWWIDALEEGIGSMSRVDPKPGSPPPEGVTIHGFELAPDDGLTRPVVRRDSDG